MEEDGAGLVAVGILQEFIQQIGVIWSFIPREIKEIHEGQIFANVESSKRLAPFRSPLAGIIVEWSDKIGRPDQITSEDWLFKIKVKE